MLRAVLFLLLLAGGPALAGLETAGTARIAAVVDGDTVALAEPVDGADEIRLVGLQAPKLPLGRKDFEAWPLAPEAKAALEDLVLGETVALAFGGRRVDRHGRLLAHLFTEDGTWVQGAMLERGMARVYSFADNRTRVAAMLRRERLARAAGRGIWGHPYYAVRGIEPEPLLGQLGTFQLVEGRVLDTARVRDRVYLNFGPKWRTDFTVMIPADALELFEQTSLDPLALKGETVRVRGWLSKYNGPMIEVDHPERIELP